MKMIVVDDEYWVRKGIVQSIHFQRHGIHLVAEAEEGEEALVLLDKERPDIMLMDMRMPEVDGRQLLKLAKEMLPDLQIIVISGYADFEYTREAIIHHVFDYILKPVKAQELNETLERAAAEVRRIRTDFGRTNATEPPVAWDGEPKAALAIWDGGRDEESGRRRVKYELAKYGWSLEIWQRTKGLWSGLVHGRQLRVEALAECLRLAAAEHSMRLGLSEAVYEVRQLHEAHAQALKALRALPAGGGEMLRRFDADGAVEERTYPQDKEHAILLNLANGEQDKALGEYRSFVAALTAAGATIGHVQRGLSRLVQAIDKQLAASGAQFAAVGEDGGGAWSERIHDLFDVEEAAGLIADLLGRTAQCFAALAKRENKQIVSSIVERMHRRYFEPISLNDLAQHYYLHPDYLSRLFRKETGVTFIDHLTDIRIAKAKQLLGESSYKFYEISAMVGYEDYRYFSQVFKRITGKTLGEYRREVRNENINASDL